jgi:hypothetical protein
MVAPTCFDITLPSSGSVPSAFWEMLNWAAVDRILWMGVLCLVTWCVAGRSGSRSPVGVRYFAHVQTGRRAHPASSTMGTGSFPGVKRPGRVADHPPLLAPRSRNSWTFVFVTGLLLPLPYSWWWACWCPKYVEAVSYICWGSKLHMLRQ